MPTLKELRFTIEGKINGEEMTPLTMPMARLLEYLADLSLLLGSKESVHFMKVEEGSSAPVLLIDADAETTIAYRVRSAQKGEGPRDANYAYKRIDARLREDEGTAKLLWDKKTELIEFPGKKLAVADKYGPIQERASVVGKLRRVGGLDETVPIWLERTDGEILYCECSEIVAEQLAPLYSKHVRLHGIGIWTRNEEGAWKMQKFRIQSYDPNPLSDRSILATFEELRAIPTGWSEIDDPLEELRRLRHGNTEPQ